MPWILCLAFAELISTFIFISSEIDGYIACRAEEVLEECKAIRRTGFSDR
jgi:hypothetical protein